MALQKQTAKINFSQAINTKEDPLQVSFGKFLSINNAVFEEGDALTKANGYGALTSLPTTTSTLLTTFNGDPTAIGTSIYAYSSGYMNWVNRGTLRPISLDVLPLIRNNTNQSQMDSAVSNGLICTAYTDQDPTNLGASVYKYSVADVDTGQTIIAPTLISSADATYGAPRVFVLGNYFVIVFTNLVSVTYHLKFIAVSVADPTVVTAAADISTSYTPSSTVAFDGAVLNNALYVAWNGAASSGMKMAYIVGSTLAVSNSVNPDPSHEATLVSVCADAVNSVIWVSYYNSGTSTGYTFAVSPTTVTIPVTYTFTVTAANATRGATYTNSGVTFTVTNTIAAGTTLVCTALGAPAASGTLTKSGGTGDSTITYSVVTASGLAFPRQIISTGTILNLTSTAYSGVLTAFYEVSNTYSFAGSIASNYIRSVTCTQAGTVGSPATVIRSVGLASKAFLLSGASYFLTAYSSPYQPTYFLSDSSGNVIAKVAYQNGGGYLTTGLPSVTVTGTQAQVGYLIKDQIQAVNKDTNVASGTQVAGIYSQTGINLATFDFTTTATVTAEIGSNLNITGGFLWGYDGYAATEQGFFLYPDSVTAAAQADPTPTGTATDTSNVLTAMSAVTGLGIGMAVSGAGIPGSTVVTAVGTTTVTLSKAATSSHSGSTYTFTGIQTNQKYYFQVTYEWTDQQGNAFRSSPSIPATATTSSGNSTITIGIPTLRLTYKTANPVKIVIYQWSIAQQSYYQLTTLSAPALNSTTTDSITYIACLSDAQVLGNNLIYTTGGVLENIGGPAFISTFIYDDRLFGITAEDQNLLWYSKQVLESTPVELSDLLTIYIPPSIGAQGSTGPLKCGAQMDDKAVLFKASAINYFNGTGPDNTGANAQYSPPAFITSTVGCSNQKSIVFQPEGLMFEFASQAGNQIWLLGRDLSTRYIGSDVEGYTTDATVQSAVNIPGENQVRFTLSSGITLIYDYYYKLWSTRSIPAVTPISSTIYQGLHTFINSFGAVYQETPGLYVDGSTPVLMSFKTGWLSLAGLQGYQRAYYFFLLATYNSPHKLYMEIAYDYNPVPTQSYTISPSNYSGAYGTSNYGVQSPYGGPGLLEQFRNNLKQQKCQAFQITLTEIYDASLGVAPGAGFKMSGINIVYGMKKGYAKISPKNSVG